MWWQRFLENACPRDKDDTSGSGTAEDPSGTDEDLEALRKAVGDMPDKVLEAFKEKAESTGGYEQFAEVLYQVNKDQRDELRKLRKNQPPEGAEILKDEDAENYRKYKELGTPEELTEQQTELTQLQQQEAQRQADALAERAANAEGYNPDVVKRLAQMDGITLDVVEGEGKEGEEPPMNGIARVPAEEEGEDPTEQSLKDYAEANWKSFEDSLNASTKSDDAGSKKPSSQQPAGPRLPKPAPKGSNRSPNSDGGKRARRTSSRYDQHADNAGD